jgi:hypothetical protein
MEKDDLVGMGWGSLIGTVSAMLYESLRVLAAIL